MVRGLGRLSALVGGPGGLTPRKLMGFKEKSTTLDSLKMIQKQ